MVNLKRAALCGAGAALATILFWILARRALPAHSGATSTDLALDLLMAVSVGVAVVLGVRWGDRTAESGSRAASEAESTAPPEPPRERRLGRSQKLESMGELTGAVAHDFNNVLTAIITPVQLILAELPVDHPLRPQLQEVEDAATRGAALSRQLLAFGRKQVVQPRPHDLNEIVAGIEPMLRRLLGSPISLDVRPATRLHTVVVDPTQIEQVLVNLVVNARDAMPEGGRLHISTTNVDPERDPVRNDGPETPAGHVCLEVSDTGVGFDEDVRRRLFEPYFSTKEDGTGLGLSTVFGIAKQSRGFVRVESTPGAGACFRVYLPAVEQPAEPIVRRPAIAGVTKGGSELLLVVEDQEPVRQVLVRALTRFGYNVIPAQTAEEALAFAEEEAGEIDLLLTDVRLPGRSGPDLARALQRRCPALKVIYISGFTDQEVLEEAGPGGRWVFLPKPFSVEDLLGLVRRVLDRDDALDHAI